MRPSRTDPRRTPPNRRRDDGPVASRRQTTREGRATAGDGKDGAPREPSKGKLRAQALEQARRERKARNTAARMRLIGLRESWVKPDPARGPGATSAAPPVQPGAYADPPAGPSDFPPKRRGWRRVLGLRMTVYAAVIVAVIVLFVVRRGPSGGPTLATNCTTPAVAITPSSVRQQKVVRYAVTGPSDVTFAVAVDAIGVRPGPDGKYKAVPPKPGVPIQAISVGNLKNCKASGVFVAQVPPGAHKVTLLQITNGTAKVAASTPLTVTAN